MALAHAGSCCGVVLVGASLSAEPSRNKYHSRRPFAGVTSLMIGAKQKAPSLDKNLH